MSSRSNTRPNRNSHILDLRGDVLGQIVKDDAVDNRRAVGMEDCLPLDKAGGIVNVAAASKEIEAAAAPHLDAPPLGEILRIEDVALIGALGHRVRAEQ